MTVTFVSSGQTLVAQTLNSGDIIDDFGTTEFTYINNGGVEYAFAGGVDIYTTVNSGGTEEVEAGGTAEYGVVYGNATFSTVDAFLDVNLGGQTIDMAIVSGGDETVSSGGISNSDIIEASGEQDILSGGIANSTTIDSGGHVQDYSGTMNSALIDAGGNLYVDYGGGGVANNTIVYGYLQLGVGGEDETNNAAETANAAIIQSGGDLDIMDRGLALNTVVLQGGTLDEYGGGKDEYSTILSGATLQVEFGTSISATISSGGLLSNSDGLVYSAVIAAGGREIVTYADKFEEGVSAGSSLANTVLSGGSEVVIAGGFASGTTVSSGGYEVVSSGGSATGTIVESQGTEDVLGGGTVSGTMLSGLEFIFSGSVSFNDDIRSGGTQYVYESGAVASSTIIESGGVEVLNGGGSIVNTDIESGGILDLAGITYTGPGTITSNATKPVSHIAVTPNASIETTTLTITEGDQTITLQLSGDYTGEYFHLSQGTGDLTGTLLTVNDTPPCFAEGTRILTGRGEIAVEALRPGDHAVTRIDGRDALSKIIWIGQRRVDISAHPRPEFVRPIRFAPGALADGLPSRALLLSPDHGLLIDGVLIAARQLVNFGSITTQHQAAVRYFHVELERHAILRAEGVETESYLDTGNRRHFSNAGDAVTLHPDFSRADHPQACAPLMTDPAVVRPIWNRLALRAAAHGFALQQQQTTREAEPCLVLPDGRAVLPRVHGDGRHIFMLPDATRSQGALQLRSRHAAVSDVHPWSDDRRQLGVACSAITLWTTSGGLTPIELSLDDPALGEGWWAIEHDQNRQWRWTDGDALLEVPADCRHVDITISGASIYLHRITEEVQSAL